MQDRIKAASGPRVVRRCRRTRSLRSERGGALIEIMMGALLVALAATAVFKGIDGAFAVSGASKSRAVAAALAQEDQERLRATIPADLPGLDQTRTSTRTNVVYTVRSTARWVADRDAAPGCTAATSRAGYLRISSTVTWPDMRGSKPVVATSILAPPNGTVTSNRGAIGVKVLDGATPPQPVSGVSVYVTGPGLSGATDANGCVFWDDVPQGNYQYTAQKGGYVDYNGNTSVTRPISVAGGQTRIDQIVLDVPAGMTVAVRTKGYDGVVYDAPLDANVPADRLHLSNSKMSAFNGVRSWSLSSVTASVSGLFPMQYGVYVGPCSFENNPANQAGTPAGTGVFSPPFTGTNTVYKPMIKAKARYLSAVNGLDGVPVRIVQLSQPSGNCTKDYGTLTTTTVSDGNAATDDAGRLPNLQNTPTVIPRGYPYGQYRVCAESRGPTGTAPWVYDNRTVTLNNPDGVTLDLNMVTPGRCP